MDYDLMRATVAGWISPDDDEFGSVEETSIALDDVPDCVLDLLKPGVEDNDEELLRFLGFFCDRTVFIRRVMAGNLHRHFTDATTH